MTKKKKQPQLSTSGKRPYTKPELRVHGDLRAMTLVKKGSMADGNGKPRTKLSGGNS